MTLEERVQRLEDIQEITYLLGKYFNNLDIHNWEAVAETFDIDVHTEYCEASWFMKAVRMLSVFWKAACFPSRFRPIWATASRSI